MKICWDNLEGFSIGIRTGQFRRGHYTYIEIDTCSNCGESYLMNKYKPTKYCCVSCGKQSSSYTHNEATREKIEPGLALDPDNGIACCKICHNKYGHKNECSPWNLSRIKCNKEKDNEQNNY